ncbi:MAG TPA: NADP-dependent phosphogluconate dehydrogenase [Blastocatellia bacterium]|nr:NADP-dependent phosphogluconate dehydrogenase [Blastocatellia bacterium]
MSAQSKPELAKIGMVGLAVMGENLALNIARNGYPIAVFNRDTTKVDKFLDRAKSHAEGQQVVGAYSIEDFVQSIERPRKIILLVKAGGAVDAVIEQLKPLLEPGDIIIDGGNSFYQNTVQREKKLKGEGFNFIGCGVSGGEKGALWGPSLMPGGDRAAYEELRPIWEKIAAQVDDGPCVTYVGPDGAGHFVKMVHNGIEYGDMQLIAEAYSILRHTLGLEAAELADVFAKWNEGELNSFLIEITAQIFQVKDRQTGKPLVDLILDVAGQKGTGKWTSDVALDLGVVIPTIQAAVDARVMSGLKDQRVEASKQLPGPAARYGGDKQEMIDAVHDALYASKICSYAQGMNLIRRGSDEYKWDINLGELSRIWKGGCIIRAQFLDKIKQAYQRRPDLPNLLVDPDFRAWVLEAQPRWRQAVTTAQGMGIAVPAMSGSLSYFDMYRTASLPLNLTQAQRDFFGSHTYQRTDDASGQFIHTEWEEELEKH